MRIFAALLVWFALSLSIVSLTSSTGLAAEQIASLTLQVSLGDKITKFEIPDSRKTLLRVNSRERKTLRGNIDTAFAKATEALKEKSNDLKLCHRENIQLVLKDKLGKENRLDACVGSKTPAAVKLTELTNLLTLM